MIGTKIRALYQRNKGRDLFDLYKVDSLGVNWKCIVESFKKLNVSVSAKEYLKNLNMKMQNPVFLNDIKPLLPTNIKYDPQDAYQWFCDEIIPLI